MSAYTRVTVALGELQGEQDQAARDRAVAQAVAQALAPTLAMVLGKLEQVRQSVERDTEGFQRANVKLLQDATGFKGWAPGVRQELNVDRALRSTIFDNS